jgi:cyclophilin family peptidyl-prolyl cis-trans isomerase
LFFIAVSYKVTAQITYIPDPLFEQELIAQNIDSDGIVNGQILTSDALAVTSLTIYAVGSSIGQYINDLTGLEDFINLESLTVNVTMVEELNINTLLNLKYLDCVDNMLTSIDVSNNILLEYLDITSGGDVEPMNAFTEIDLSNNPNIHTLNAMGIINKINLNNGSNNSNMFINVSAGYWVEDGEFYGNVCIEVDDVELAQNNQYPYSEWTIYHSGKTYSYTDNVEDCSLSTHSFTQNKISIYPNPVSDVLYFETTDTIIEKVMVFDLSGRKVLEQNNVDTISVLNLQKGNYILKIVSDKGIQTEKIIVK